MERLINLRKAWGDRDINMGEFSEGCRFAIGESCFNEIRAIIQEIESLQSELAALKEETRLLRRIAAEAKSVWDKNQLPLEADQLKNLLTDRIDFDIRHKPIDLPNERNETC